MKYYIVNGLDIRTIVKPTCIFERVAFSMFVDNRHENTETGDYRVLVDKESRSWRLQSNFRKIN